jgi:hypothetical protein
MDLDGSARRAGRVPAPASPALLSSFLPHCRHCLPFRRVAPSLFSHLLKKTNEDTPHCPVPKVAKLRGSTVSKKFLHRTVLRCTTLLRPHPTRKAGPHVASAVAVGWLAPFPLPAHRGGLAYTCAVQGQRPVPLSSPAQSLSRLSLPPTALLRLGPAEWRRTAMAPRPAETPRRCSGRSTTSSRRSCSPTPPSSSPRSRASGSIA